MPTFVRVRWPERSIAAGRFKVGVVEEDSIVAVVVMRVYCYACISTRVFAVPWCEGDVLALAPREIPLTRPGSRVVA